MMFAFIVGFLFLIFLLGYMLYRRKIKYTFKEYDSKLQKAKQDSKTTISNIETERKRNESLIIKNEELKRERDFAEKKSAMLQNRLVELTANKNVFQDIVGFNAVEQKLMAAGIYKVVKDYLAMDKMVNDGIMTKVSNMMDINIPTFKSKINSSNILSKLDYNICLLIRLHFKPSEISRLLGVDSATLAMKRKRLLKKIYGTDGSARDFDRYINSIY